MNRMYSAIAASALALGAGAFTATEASALVRDPQPGSGSGPTTTGMDCYYPPHPSCGTAPEVTPVVPSQPAASLSDDSRAEALQAGASALAGAGLAFGGMWLYRRRQAPAV